MTWQTCGVMPKIWPLIQLNAHVCWLALHTEWNNVSLKLHIDSTPITEVHSQKLVGSFVDKTLKKGYTNWFLTEESCHEVFTLPKKNIVLFKSWIEKDLFLLLTYCLCLIMALSHGIIVTNTKFQK